MREVDGLIPVPPKKCDTGKSKAYLYFKRMTLVRCMYTFVCTMIANVFVTKYRLRSTTLL